MSRRRAPLIAIKAKARLDLLARVISMAASLVFIPLITNPVFLCDSTAFALAEENNPGSEEPAGDQGTQKNENRFPHHHGYSPVGDGAAHHGIDHQNREKVESTDQTKPRQAPEIASEQLAVGPKGFTQSFVVKDEGNLDRAEGENKSAHENALEREIVQHVRHINKISEEHWQPQHQHADDNNNTGPFQDVTESAHGKGKKSAFAKTQSFDPGQTDGDEVNLNINSGQVFEDEGERIDGGGDFQKMRGGDFVVPTRQPPIDERFKEGSQGTDEENRINRNAPPTVKFE